MTSIISRMLFGYGAGAATATAAWLIISLSRAGSLAVPLWVAEFAFLIHGAVLVTTLHRGYSSVTWPPAVGVTRSRVIVGRFLLGAATTNALAWLALLFIMSWSGQLAPAEWALWPMLASLFFLSSVYIAVHWALRPENFLPREILAFLSNPFGAVLRWVVGRW